MYVIPNFEEFEFEAIGLNLLTKTLHKHVFREYNQWAKRISIVSNAHKSNNFKSVFLNIEENRIYKQSLILNF